MMTARAKELQRTHDAICRACDELGLAIRLLVADQDNDTACRFTDTIARLERDRDRVSARLDEERRRARSWIRRGRDSGGPRWFLVESQTAMLDAIAGVHGVLDPVEVDERIEVLLGGAWCAARFEMRPDGTAMVHLHSGVEPLADGTPARRPGGVR